MSELALAADFALIIVVATVVGLLGHRLGQPSLIAYILSGLILGPVAFDLVTADGLIELMAELGLAFLLFLLGIKMRLEDIRPILKPVVRISIVQMTLVFVSGAGLALALGFARWEAVVIGLAVMYSSTAVVIKMLSEKDEVTSLPGMIDVGILLVQDIVVVILLTVLATGRPESVPAMAVTLGTILVLIAVIGVIALGSSRYLLPRVFRRIADDKDVFFVVAIAWSFLFIFVTDTLDLSIEMGAFLAGVAIAQLPYSEELQARISPVTDLFILIFFVSIGLQLEAADLITYWPEAVVAVIVLLPAKFLIFFFLIDWQDFSVETSFLGSANMVQVSEFGLVVGAVAVAGGFIDPPVLGFLSLVALLTMGVSVYVIKYNQALYARFGSVFHRWGSGDPPEVRGRRYEGHAVAIGYDEITRSALSLLDAEFDTVVVIDRRIDHIEELAAGGTYEFVYGDVRHSGVRKEANLQGASFVLSSSVEVPINRLVIDDVRDDAVVFVEAERIGDARSLYAHGASYVCLSTHLAAERLREYVTLYLDDPDQFVETATADLHAIDQSNAAASMLRDAMSRRGGASDG